MTEEVQQEHDPFNLHNIFNKKPEVETQKDHQQEKPAKKVDRVKPESIVEDDEQEDKDEKEKKDEKPLKEEMKSDEIDYKSELEKAKKTIKDTQRSFHEDRKKLVAYKKAVEKLKQDGVLLDEEAEMLLDHTSFVSEPEEENEYMKYHKIWNQELQYMRKYAPDAKEVDQNFEAFQHFVQTASPQEIKDVFSDLKHYEDDEVEFTKQMLEIGRQYNEEVYADISEVGSIRQLKTKYSKKEAELQKEIDKLSKQVNKYKEQYEDYNTEPSNLRLPSGSTKNDLPKSATFDVGEIFAQRHARPNQKR
jgi:hypothetical protein